jgi:hypothetical protein
MCFKNIKRPLYFIAILLNLGIRTFTTIQFGYLYIAKTFSSYNNLRLYGRLFFDVPLEATAAQVLTSNGQPLSLTQRRMSYGHHFLTNI